MNIMKKTKPRRLIYDVAMKRRANENMYLLNPVQMPSLANGARFAALPASSEPSEV